MPVTDWEIDCLAQAMIAKHGANAARASVERLNERIEHRDWAGRDVWARVVHAIHEEQGDLDAAVLIELNRPVPTPRHGPAAARR